jgi:predicted Zn-dependent protease
VLGAALLAVSARAADAPDLDAILGPQTVAPPKAQRVPFTPSTLTAEQIKNGKLEELARDPQALVRFLEADPSRLSAEGRNPADVLNFAQVLLRLDQTFLAERLLGNAARKWPEDVDVTSAWARVLVSLGRPDAAMPVLERDIAARPTDPSLRYLQGRALLGTEPRTPEVEAQAAAAFEKVLALKPDYQDPEGVTAQDLRAIIDRLRNGEAQSDAP